MTAVASLATRRRPERRTRGGEVARISRLLGAELMPWQQQVADVALEVDDDGRLCYREVVVSVPRQSGKTWLILCMELHKVLFGPNVEVVYSAQAGTAAFNKLVLEQVPLIEQSELGELVRKVYRTPLHPGVWFRNGSRIVPLSNSPDAGHGRTVDMAVIDEAFADQDDRREQAYLAAMATRPDGQLWVVSTAGDDTSAYLNRKLEAAAGAVEADSGRGIAAFVWSASKAQIADPDRWHEFHPAMGHTIDRSVMEHAQASMDAQEFERAFGNRRAAAAESSPIPESVWSRLVRADVVPVEPVFGVEVAADRGSAAIVAVDGDGRCELVRVGEGTSWLVDAAGTLAERAGGVVVAVDGKGPSGPLVPRLAEVEGVTVVEVGAEGMGRACAGLVDACADGRLSVRGPAPLLDLAVGDGRRRWSGDRWYWARKGAVDASPLVALTVGWWVACGSGVPRPSAARVAPWVMV